MKNPKTLVIAFALILSASAPAGIQPQIRLAWDPSPSASVVGYKLYWGPSPGVHPNSRDVGKALQVQIPMPQPPVFFVVTAYDANGIESGPSNELNGSLPLQQ